MDIIKVDLYGSRKDQYINFKRSKTTVESKGNRHKCRRDLARPCGWCKGNRLHSTKKRVTLKEWD